MGWRGIKQIPSPAFQCKPAVLAQGYIG